jgi:hypothetical protein
MDFVDFGIGYVKRGGKELTSRETEREAALEVTCGGGRGATQGCRASKVSN